MELTDLCLMMHDRSQQQDDYYKQSVCVYGHNQQQYGSYKSNMYGQQGHQYSYDQHSSLSCKRRCTGKAGKACMEGVDLPNQLKLSRVQAVDTASAQCPIHLAAPRLALVNLKEYHSNTALTRAAKMLASQQVQALPCKVVAQDLLSTALKVNRLGTPKPSKQASRRFGQYPQYGGGFGNFGGQQSAHPADLRLRWLQL